MKKNSLSEFSLEELSKRKKKLSAALIGFTIVMVIAYSILVYFVFKSRKFGLIAIIPAGFITLLPMMIGLSQVNAEIKSRQ